MDTLPVELLQVINDCLEFLDQVNFKRSCKWHHEEISTQIIPHLLIRSNTHLEYQCDGSKHWVISVEDCVRLDKFYLQLPKYITKWNVYSTSYNVCVMSPNRYNKIMCKKSLFDDIFVCDYEAEILFEYTSFTEDAQIRYDLTDFELVYCPDTNTLELDEEPFVVATLINKCIDIFNQ